MSSEKNTAHLFGMKSVRLLSLLLVVAMVSGVMVYKETGLPDTDDSQLRLEERAAAQILAQSRYGQASRLTRMRMFLQNMLGRNDSAEDYETAMAINLAQGNYEEAAQLAELASSCPRRT